MRTSFFKNAFLALITASIASAELLDKDHYLQKVAPKVLAHLSDFRAQHNNLTLAQEATLDLSEGIVRNFAVEEINALESLCNAAFSDKSECAKILGDGNASTTTSLHSDSIKRAPACTCSTSTDFCYMRGSNTLRCHAGDKTGQCAYASGECPIVFHDTERLLMCCSWLWPTLATVLQWLLCLGCRSLMRLRLFQPAPLRTNPLG